MTRTAAMTDEEYDDFILTMYHADRSRFQVFCDDDDCNRVDDLNERLTNKQISEAIERYNERTFGVTRKECEAGKCVYCNDKARCEKYGAKKDYD